MKRFPAVLLFALLLAWPAGAGPGKDKIFKPDDRHPVLDTTVWPWRAACRVYVEYPDGVAAVGSGILVGPRHVLTAGHVVYDEADGGLAEFAEVAPGYEYGYAPYGYAQAVDIRVLPGWLERSDFDYDMALLVLNRDVGNGWIEVGALSDDWLLAHDVTTAGYPADLGGTEALYATEGPVDAVDPQTLFYSGALDVYFGQSGSGLWMDGPGGDPAVVGVISWSTSTGNGGPRVTVEKADYVESWIETGADPANLAVAGIGTSLPAEVERGAAGTVTATVENAGGAAASSLVEVRFEDSAGADFPVGSAAVNLGPGVSEDHGFLFSVPAGAAAGLGRIRAEVNRSGGEPEWPRTDNEGVREVVVLPEWEDAILGSRVTTTLSPRAVARYRLMVGGGLTRLDLRVSLKAGQAEVRRPGGSTFAFVKKWTEANPEGGTWEILVRNTRDVTAKAKFLAR